MSKLAKMIRDVVGPGDRKSGDTYLPHIMTVHDQDRDALLTRLVKAFPAWKLTLLLEKEVGLKNVNYYWCKIDDVDGKPLGALRLKEDGPIEIAYTEFHKWTTMDEFHQFIRQQHHFHTSIVKFP